MSRDHSIPLPNDVSRCEPRTRGPAAVKCARARAVIGHGSPVGDFSDNLEGCTVLCPWFEDAARLRRQPLPAVPVKVHKPLRGM